MYLRYFNLYETYPTINNHVICSVNNTLENSKSNVKKAQCLDNIKLSSLHLNTNIIPITRHLRPKTDIILLTCMLSCEIFIQSQTVLQPDQLFVYINHLYMQIPCNVMHITSVPGLD